MSILDILGKRIVFFDGGTGTLLQAKGLGPGELPEKWNIEKSSEIISLHRDYFAAGCDIVKTNTFGANSLKFDGKEGRYTVEEVIGAAVKNARTAAEEFTGKYVALDLGPTGKLLKPLGDLEFEEAYSLFGEAVDAGVRAGVDLILIETMSDTYEMKAAVLAAKERSNLPVFATMIFDEEGSLLTGGDVPSAVALMEGLGVDALGVNCGLGPVQMKPVFEEIMRYASIPVIVNPNAGLPRSVGGKTVFDIEPAFFAGIMKEMAQEGAWIVGGCCGTTPAHIKALCDACNGLMPKAIEKKDRTLVSSYARAVEIGRKPVIIGERINPTGKSKFKQALREKNFGYILQEALAQQEKGAHVLDVNVGLPEIDETEMMAETVKELQSVIDLPLQIDTSSIEAMEKALRIYNGKALVNSVNGKREVMEAVFPLIKKYGGVVVGLTLDENGIPEKAEDRVFIARKIYSTAAEYGIDKKDVIIDALTMTISSNPMSAIETLRALKMIQEDLKGKTILGVSNISFGLPQRNIINASFYTMALQNGLSAAIINPNAEDMMRAYHSFLALFGMDSQCQGYIASYGTQEAPKGADTANKGNATLLEAIEKGLKDRAQEAAGEKLLEKAPLDIINEDMIPALDKVGKGFEKKTVFLPQLLMSAEAAKAAFDVLKSSLEKSGAVQEKKGKVILATVKGDIHDIGKNIVKVLLENYSYEVLDLGKDVPPEKIVEVAKAQNVRLIGLSALMTTTVTSMETTIRLLRENGISCTVMVGGAVLTEEYAEMIGADFYAKDAMASVHYAQKVLG